MSIEEKVEVLSSWGKWMSEPSRLDTWSEEASKRNPWFYPDFVRQMILGFCDSYLRPDPLADWLSKYDFNSENVLSIAVICAGNLPAVGFHDVLCVLCSPYHGYIKLSSKDDYLLPQLLEFFKGHPWKSRLKFVEKLKNFDATIATGSNSGLDYFQQYFGGKPHIFRGHRNGIAVISGHESESQLRELGKDIFEYFGLGCRSVSLVAVPKGWDIRPAMMLWETQYEELSQNNKYMNNYDYNKALLLLNKEEHLSSANLHVVKSDSLHSRISVLHQWEYQDTDELLQWIQNRENDIQCVVTDECLNLSNAHAFGYAQRPALDDYADRKDTMQFLSQL